MEDDVRFSICRLCLSGDVDLINVFDSSGIIEHKPADVINELLQHEVSADDKYPQCICTECMRKLKEFKRFKQKCDSCRELLDKAYVVKRTIGRSEAEGHCEQKDVGVQREEVVTPDTPAFTPKVEPDVNTAQGSDTTDTNNRQDDLAQDDNSHSSGVNEYVCSLEEDPLAEMDDTAGDVEGRYEDLEGREIPNFKCSECGKQLLTLRGYNFHVNLHKYGRDLKCDICREVFPDKTSLMGHVTTHVNKRAQCQVCKKYYNNKNSMKKHMVVHGEKQFECAECVKRFFTKNDLKRHARTHNRIRHCSVCGDLFYKKELLRLHKEEAHK